MRVKIDDGDDTIGKKIRTHRKMRPAYLMILGDGEMNSNCVSLRSRTGAQVSDIPLDQFISDLTKEIDDKIAEPALVPELRKTESPCTIHSHSIKGKNTWEKYDWTSDC